MVKNHLQCRRPGFNPWVGKIPWRRECQPTPVFLPGESHGQRSLVGYSPWGRKELDMTEHFFFSGYLQHLIVRVCLNSEGLGNAELRDLGEAQGYAAVLQR